MAVCSAVLVLPHCCANGHQWQNFNWNQDRGNYFLHCTTRETVASQRSDDTDENSDSPSTKKKVCNRKLTWTQARCPSIVVALWLPTHICGVCIGSVMIVLTTLHCTKAGSCHHKDVEQACSSLALDFAIGNVSLARLTRQAWWPWQSRRH